MACEDHFDQTFRPTVHTCDRWTCPECYHRAVTKATRRAVENITGRWGAYEASGRVGMGPVDHVVLSLPGWGNTGDGGTWEQSWVDDYNVPATLQEAAVFLRLIRREASEKLRMMGMKGWCVVVHPYRFMHRDGTACEDKMRCQEKHIRYWSPHVHVMGHGYLMPSKEFYKRTGWIYKKIRLSGDKEERKKWGADRGELYKVVRYLLTHVGLVMRDSGRMSNTLTYGGLWGPGRVAVTESHDWETQICPECGRGMLDVRVGVLEGVVVIEGWGMEHLMKVTVRKYRIRRRWWENKKFEVKTK
ncbi:hypothetical protein ES703_86195 [subsurface metagenome]